MKRFALMFALSIATLGATVVAMHREAAADHPCHKISARIADALVAEGCPSPFGLCTAGTISGDGLIRGTVFNVVNDLAPAATEGDLSFDTSMTIGTDDGDVTFHGSAVFDPVHGAISIIALSPEGTGRFAGATGRLFIHANTTPEAALGEIDGEICLAR